MSVINMARGKLYNGITLIKNNNKAMLLSRVLLIMLLNILSASVKILFRVYTVKNYQKQKLAENKHGVNRESHFHQNMYNSSKMVDNENSFILYQKLLNSISPIENNNLS